MEVLATPATVADGYISGELSPRARRCERCGKLTRCIRIHDVVLPEGVTLRATILQRRGEEDPTLITYIGLGCGDYARFHRQIVHISGG